MSRGEEGQLAPALPMTNDKCEMTNDKSPFGSVSPPAQPRVAICRYEYEEVEGAAACCIWSIR